MLTFVLKQNFSVALVIIVKIVDELTILYTFLPSKKLFTFGKLDSGIL